MPVLAAFLGNIIFSITQFLAKFLTRRVAIVFAAIAVVLSLTATFVAGIVTLITGISHVIPIEVSIAASWLVPPHAITCLGAYLAALVARWVYEWNIRIIQWKLV